MGGLPDSATKALGDMSRPLSYSKPVDKICEVLKKNNAQICDLRFGENKLQFCQV